MEKLEKGTKLVGTVRTFYETEKIEGVVLKDFNRESNPQNPKFSFNDRFIEVKITKHDYDFSRKNEIITIRPVFRDSKILSGKFTFEIQDGDIT